MGVGNSTTYIETFNGGTGGWLAFVDNRLARLEMRDGAVVSRSPWWVDYNHAPPGTGYLHLLFALYTSAEYWKPEWNELSGPNRFINQNKSRCLTNARVTLRLRGEVNLRGSQMMLLVQSRLSHVFVCFVLTGQPFEITKDWSEQTVTLKPDPGEWVCLGTRHDKGFRYGWGELGDVLRDVNGDIIFVLFPLKIVPLEQAGDLHVSDLHIPRADLDYKVDRSYLPEGEVWFDTVKIEYPK